jgi:SAM-dependent methyltransferase
MSQVLQAKLTELSAEPSTSTQAKEASTTKIPPGDQASSRISFSLKEADASKLPFESGSFDVAVETFGLCSYRNPDAVLAELSRVVDPSHGKILLLEHGRSRFRWNPINWYLDWRADAHERSWGCRYNRSIDQILANSPVEVVSHERHHYGTTHFVIARPKSSPGSSSNVSDHLRKPSETKVQVDEKKLESIVKSISQRKQS